MLKIPKKTNTNTTAQILMKRRFIDMDISGQMRRDETGLDGELYLSKLFLEELQVKPIILYGVRLVVDEKECQVDCLMIFQDKCMLIEVKNYRGDYFYDRGKFYFVSSKDEIDSPLEQLNRTTRMFRRFLQEIRMNFEVIPRLVFTGKEFQLYQSDLSLPIIHPGQIRRYIKKLNNESCNLNPRHTKLEEIIYARHRVFSSYEKKYEYEYDQLVKKMSCEKCDGMMKSISQVKMSCSECNVIEPTEMALSRNIDEFIWLFPEIKITTSRIYEWIGESISQYSVRKYLKSHMVEKGSNKNRSYVKL